MSKGLGNRHATFHDLCAAGRPALYVIGTNLSTGYAEVFSAERHASMKLTTAVRISMSIPLFFAAMRHGTRGDVYVDGGTLDFDIPDARKQALIEEGIAGAERYFTWFENPDEAPVNRIESIVKRPVPSGTGEALAKPPQHEPAREDARPPDEPLAEVDMALSGLNPFSSARHRLALHGA